MSIVRSQISIHEYGCLLRGGDAKSLSASSISEKDWDWLLQNEELLAGNGSSLFRPAIKQGKQVLQVLNYVGVLSFPSGTNVEILPKISETGSEESSRLQLLKMLAKVNDLPLIQLHEANLKTINRPLLELLIGRFLQDVQHLVNRGLRSQYTSVQRNEAYLRGKLRASVYLRLPPQKRTRFPIEYDEYLLARPENMLVHWAVNQVYHWSVDAVHRSHARKLLTLLSDIPQSVNPLEDLKKWQDERLMQHYSHVKPWIVFIVNNLSPWTQTGNANGVSLLFPMEQLFEKYVFKVLKEKMEAGYTISSQTHAGHLTQHKGKDWFLLKPDLVIQKHRVRISLMDTKWKVLDETASDKKYGISQSDMYQLFAYGKQCLPEGGSLFLVYPRNSRFNKPLPVFSFGNSHKLWAVPFCLETDKFIIGDWTQDADYLLKCASL